MDFQELNDISGEFAKLAAKLQGRGVPDVHQALKELQLEPVHAALKDLLSRQVLGDISQLCFSGGKKFPEQKLNQIEKKFQTLLQRTMDALQFSTDSSEIGTEFKKYLLAIQGFSILSSSERGAQARKPDGLFGSFIDFESGSNQRNILVLFGWMVVSRLRRLKDKEVFEELQFTPMCESAFTNCGRSPEESRADVNSMRILLDCSALLSEIADQEKFDPFSVFLERKDVQVCMNVNIYNGVTYYNKELFEEMIRWLFTIGFIERITVHGTEYAKAVKEMKEVYRVVQELTRMSERSKYKFDSLQEIISAKNKKSTFEV